MTYKAFKAPAFQELIIVYYVAESQERQSRVILSKYMRVNENAMIGGDYSLREKNHEKMMNISK